MLFRIYLRVERLYLGILCKVTINYTNNKPIKPSVNRNCRPYLHTQTQLIPAFGYRILCPSLLPHSVSSSSISVSTAVCIQRPCCAPPAHQWPVRLDRRSPLAHPVRRPINIRCISDCLIRAITIIIRTNRATTISGR